MAGLIQVKQTDDLENLLAKNFLRFLSMRAESFQVLRRKPVLVMRKYVNVHNHYPVIESRLAYVI